MAYADLRPGELDLRFRPGNGVAVVLNWPMTLTGRTFAADLDGNAITLAVGSSTMTVSASEAQTALVTNSATFHLRETTGGLNETLITGTWVADTSGTTAQTSTVAVAAGVVNVEVSVVGAPGPQGPGGSGGGGGSIAVSDEGTQIAAAASSLNFVGAGVTATQASGAVTVTVPDGGAGKLVAANNLSDLGSAATARTNLGLGTAATQPTSAFDAAGAAAAAQAAAIAASQPLDSDLTAIAALSTTTFGRSLLTQADAAATRSTLGLGTAALVDTGTGAGNVPTVTQADARYAPITGIPESAVTNLTTDLAGKAASTHTHAESDTTNLVTDLAAKAPLASPALTGTPTAPTAAGGTNTTQIATTAFVAAGFQPLDSDLTAIAALATTSYGRALLTAANLAALQAILGPTGSPSSTTYLRGDGSWNTPAGGGGFGTPTTKTAAYTAASGDIVLANASSRTVTDGVTTNTSTTVTSATAAFTSADVGRAIAGTGIPGGATIASVTNGTTVVISAAATATGSSVSLTIGGAITITSPTAAAGAYFTVKKSDSSANAVTISAASGTIDGATTDVLSVQWQAHSYVSDGTNWFKV